jgi:hypothetical protein
MLYLDVLITLLIVLWLGFQGQTLSPVVILLILIGGSIFLLAFNKIVGWLFGRFVEWSTAQKDPTMANRRRILRGKVLKTRSELHLEELDEDQLRAHIEKYPRDYLAVEILCERFQREDRWAEFARESEYYLTIADDLTHDEACARYHRLADLYLEKLNRPDRAREMLRTIVAQFPKHYQATLARRRLAALEEDCAS